MSNVANARRVTIYGIQPSGCPHLGNLLCIQLARSARVSKWVCCIADLHSLTSNINTLDYKTEIRLTTAFVLASVPSAVCTVYVQSCALAQTYLLWVICCLNKLPELARASAADARANVARVLYPSLMAADVIACRATHVVAGCDQRKHIEHIKLTSRRINALALRALKTRQLVPTITQHSKTQIKLMSLQAPSTKMSKSDPNATACLSVLDDYNSISAKLKRAHTDGQTSLPTDALGLNNRPGLTNLIEMYALTAMLSTALLITLVSAVKIDSFKRWLAKLVYIRMRTPRLLTRRWLCKPEAIDAVLASGANAAMCWSNSCVNHIKLMTELNH